MRKPSPTKKARVAFLGLGAMGAPMAERLAREGFALTVWNRSGARAAAFVKALGAASNTGASSLPEARVALSPAAAARDADVVVTMLSDAKALEEVLGSGKAGKGNDGLLAGLRKGALVIDMSTAGRAAARGAARAITRAKGRFIDVPVSGTVEPARRGELLGMAGGSAADVRAAMPVLEVLCRRVIHAGDVGQGQALKVLLNGIGAHHFVAFASMLVLGERAGLAREVLVDAFTNGAFASPSYVGKRAKVLARDFSPEFSLALALKDASLNIELQEEVGVRLDVVRSIAKVLRHAVADGLGDEDLYAVEKWFARGPKNASRASRAKPARRRAPAKRSR